jgi:hypothetical protein
MADDGSMAQYRDVIEFESDHHRLLKSYVLQGNGEWQHFMTTHYQRQL